MSDPLAAWEVSEADFPEHGSSAEQLAFCVRYAVLAPSGHNAQPWLFRVSGDSVELRADRRRALPVVDPEDRALAISCGTALALLRLAMRRFGLGETCELVPEGPGADLLARVRIVGPHVPTTPEERLFQAVLQRHTDRSAFEPRPLPEALPAALEAAAAEEEAWLVTIADPERKEQLAMLIAEGDRAQWADGRFRRELAAWLHPNRSASGDGIPGYALGIGDRASWLGPLVVRTFDTGKGIAARDRQLAAGSPALAVIGTGRDNPREWLHAGQALARVLLVTTSEGLTASFLNQPIEVESLRPRVCEVLGFPGFPQILMRLGHGGGGRPTPRRPLAEVLAIEAG